MKQKIYKRELSKMSTFKKILLTLVSALILLLQLGVYYLIFVKSKEITIVTVIVRVIGVLIVFNMLNNKNMCSTYKIIWSSIVLFFSYSGPIAYLIFGNQRSMPKRKSRKVSEFLVKNIKNNDCIEELKEVDLQGYKYTKLLNSSLHLPCYKNVKTEFYSDIEKKFYRLLEDIGNAKEYIFIESFILSTGKMLDMLIDALEAKGKENIEIKVLYDDVGSIFPLRSQTLKRLKNIPNIEVETYEPLGIVLNPAINYRDHRKIAIIDGKIGYVGGDNFGDEYANWIKKYGVWRDNCLRIEGEAVNSLVYMFSETWYMSTKTMLDINKHIAEHEKYSNDSFIYPYCDGPVNNCNPAYDLYSSIAMNAEKYLYISTPYMAINEEFIDNILDACKSGVDVRIMVPGIPDKKLVYKLTQSFYGEILKAGGKIYEYSPGFNHAKNYISDDKYGVIGTINMDYRSLYLHFENAVLLINDENIIKMKENFLEDLNKCKEVTFEDWNKRSIFVKGLEFVLRMFAALM